ncbi:MAG TPA: ArsA-related P-loop ATPase, partial [Solirubrobacteraceae bacterium]|nr:ArsA-related P-loop ATPase [Solirubrobacteraceae bacterium]
ARRRLLGGRGLSLLDRDLVVVTGKGGVGKTTVAAALGLVAARRGQRTIVAEVARRDDVSRALGGEGIQEEELAPGLHHVSIDPERAMELYLTDQLPSALAELLSSSRTFTYLAAATPGMRELLTVGKVWELAQEDRRAPGATPYDLVVLDAPATGHGVAILSAPRTFARTARVGRIARQGRTIDAMVTDPARTGVVAVARPEEMPVTETLSLQDALRDEVGLDVGLVVANAVLPQRFSAAEAVALEAAPDGPEVRAARHAGARARAQRTQLRRLRRGVRAPVATLPFVFDGDPMALLARELERSL